MKKARLAVYKFTSCDGCQLSFLNAGNDLLLLSELVEIVHFAEAGLINLDSPIDIAFVEGSISTPDEVERIKKIRQNAKVLVTIGACATAGGIQALRNGANRSEWMTRIYASADTIKTLETSTAIATHVPVDAELWGCPVTTDQVMNALRSLLFGAKPTIKRDAVCLECKRKGHVCVLITKKAACMGPVTRTGCGALCPGLNRACYACFGPSDNPNPRALGTLFTKQGLTDEQVAQQFLHINNQATAFHQAGIYFKGIKIVKKDA